MLNDDFRERIRQEQIWGIDINNFSIQYVINNNQYLKTIQEAVDVICKIKSK